MDSPEFQALRVEYMQSVLERCGYLTDAVQALQTDPDLDLMPLRQEAHKIRGSGGFYGFSPLSERAAAIEDLILQIRDGEATRDHVVLASLVAALVDAARAGAGEVGL